MKFLLGPLTRIIIDALKPQEEHVKNILMRKILDDSIRLSCAFAVFTMSLFLFALSSTATIYILYSVPTMLAITNPNYFLLSLWLYTFASASCSLLYLKNKIVFYKQLTQVNNGVKNLSFLDPFIRQLGHEHIKMKQKLLK